MAKAPVVPEAETGVPVDLEYFRAQMAALGTQVSLPPEGGSGERPEPVKVPGLVLSEYVLRERRPE